MRTKDDIQFLCQNLQLIRRKHNLTIEEMAARLNVDTESVMLLERGVLPEDLPFVSLWNICAEFSIPLASIFRPLEDENTAPPV